VERRKHSMEKQHNNIEIPWLYHVNYIIITIETSWSCSWHNQWHTYIYIYERRTRWCGSITVEMKCQFHSQFSHPWHTHTHTHSHTHFENISHRVWFRLIATKCVEVFGFAIKTMQFFKTVKNSVDHGKWYNFCFLLNWENYTGA